VAWNYRLVLSRALALPIAIRPIWIRWLSRDHLEAIEAATGVSSNDVEAMPLSVYDGTAVQLEADSQRLDATFPFGALSWSRYCPEC
jgi:hypothetical protein